MPFAHLRRLLRGVLTLTIVLGAIGLANGWFGPTETTIKEIAPGVFFRQCQTDPVFKGCNQGWVVFKDFVLVIEANFPDQAEEVVREIRKQTNKPIKFVFDTHYHGDHADGNMIYADVGATPVAAERSKPLFETKGLAGFERSQKSKAEVYGKLKYAVPSLYFPKKLVFDDGTQRVELIHFGHAHTAGDAVAWLPDHGILFTGDACVNGPFNYMGDGDLASWVSVLDQCAELPVKILAPGHGELADKTLLETQKKYFIELRAAIEKLVSAGKSLDEVKKELELPMYKEWTKVDVKTRTENIEHVYGLLKK